MRGATWAIMVICWPCALFQSTRPMRGATQTISALCWARINFNPRAPCGARLSSDILSDMRKIISIHAPHAGRDRPLYNRYRHTKKFQSTRPMRGATRGLRNRLLQRIGISIHAPHAGRDWVNMGDSYATRSDFNPRAPCGARRSQILTPADISLFQSTRPMRGATA